MAKDLSIVIPVYRSATTLRELTARLTAVLDETALDYEIIYVDDGSPDNSWQVLHKIQATRPGRVVAIQLMRNFGQHNALMCGFRHARGEIIVTMDDDLQNPPEEIPRLLAALEDTGLDVVYGSYRSKEHPGWRNLGSRLVNAFYRLVFRSSVTVTSFRCMRRQVLASIFTCSLNYTFIDGLLAWTTQRIGQALVEHHPRRHGKSGYSPGKLVVLAFGIMAEYLGRLHLNVSRKPHYVEREVLGEPSIVRCRVRRRPQPGRLRGSARHATCQNLMRDP